MKDQEIQKRLKQVLLIAKLKDLGVSEVEMTFSGSGDSGDIDDVIYRYKSKNKKSNISYYISSKIKNSDENILMQLAIDIIDSKIDTAGDLVNNKGSYASMYIDVYKQSYDLSYNRLVVQEKNYSNEMLFTWYRLIKKLW